MRAASSGSITVRDAMGRVVTLPRAPQRIVAIFSSNTELVTALGLIDRIVGIDSLTTYPPEITRVRAVGGRLGFSVDAVVEQRPDLVLVTPARNAMYQLLDPMQRIGVPVLVLLSRNVAEVVSNVRLVGIACGEAERGARLAAILDQRLNAVKQRVESRPSPRVVMITGRVGNGLLIVAQPNTYTGDAILLAGGQHALGRAIAPQVSPEALWSADPDILLYAGTKTALDELLPRQGWRDMRAIRERRAYVVSRGELLIPGPRTIDGIEHLADLFDSFRPAP